MNSLLRCKFGQSRVLGAGAEMPPWFIYHLPKGLRPPTQIVKYHNSNSLIGCWKMRKAGQDFWKFSTQVKSFDEFVCGKWEILMVVIFCHHKIGHSQINGKLLATILLAKTFTLFSAVSVPRPTPPPCLIEGFAVNAKGLNAPICELRFKNQIAPFFLPESESLSGSQSQSYSAQRNMGGCKF